MKIFLSHSRAQAQIAERLALSLRGDGHTVFFDRSDIEAGEEYDARIRKAIEACDLFVFLISPESVAPDSYPLAELAIAEERWSHPKGHVLPLVVEPVAVGKIPPYLRAVSIFDPQGDFVAESSAAIARIAKTRPRLRIPALAIIGAVAVLLIVAAVIGYKRYEQDREARRQVAQVIAAASADLDARGYSDAFRAVAEADTRFPNDPDLRKLKERIAMAWLRDIRVRVGEQTFTDVVNTVRPVLSTGAAASKGAEAADLLAHLGWGEYLRSRDSGGDIDPVSYFMRAVEADPSNPYAHAMWGFWILYERGPLAEAQMHFEQAANSGRERSYVRNLQIAALIVNHDDEIEPQAVRIANTMRLEKLSVEQPDRLWSIYNDWLLRRRDPTAFLQIIPPAEHVDTFKWLFPETSVPDGREPLYRFFNGRLDEAAGNRDSALKAYEWVENEFRKNQSTGSLLDRALEGLARLRKRA
jgi:tetratricopeptide (TPR) repeat protein